MSTSNFDNITDVITLFGFYTLNQDETGVLLTLGNFSNTLTPGLGFAIPIIQTVKKTKSSIQTIDLPDQKIVLSGNISVKISGNVNYKVTNAKRAILEVGNYEYSLRQLAMTTISDVLGTKRIEEIRSKKSKIADEIEKIVATTAAKWGLSEVDIRLTDAEMDDKLLRAMMRETEAEKEASAIKIKAQADEDVARIFASAAQQLADSPGAMTLRILQTLSDMSNSKSTVVVPIPIELLSGLGLGSSGKHKKGHCKEHTASSKSDMPPIAKVFEKEDGMRANCPHCHAHYKVNNVMGNYKFDQDDSIPGIQLKCKKCSEIFTLEE